MSHYLQNALSYIAYSKQLYSWSIILLGQYEIREVY